MVLNTKGGSNAKKIANKHVNKTKSGLRLSENKNEIYGIVKKLNGNTFDVLCYDKKIRRCILRGKFKGRGKRDNLISTETWVLIGLRDFSTASATATATATATTTEYKLCDLLEVYSSSEKESLKRTHGIKMEENDLNVKSKYTTQTTTVCSSIDFVDETTIRYQNMIRRRNVDTDSELDSDSNSELDSDSNSDDSDDSDDSDSNSDMLMPMHKQVAAPSIMMINVDDI